MMLAWVGCVADTPEVATWFGDDIAFRRDSYAVDLAGLPMMGFALSHVGAGTPRAAPAAPGRQPDRDRGPGGRAGAHVALPDHGPDGRAARARLGGVRSARGRSSPAGTPRGSRTASGARRSRVRCGCSTSPTPSRCSTGRGGVDAAVEVARARRGKHFDPEVVDLFCAAAPEVLADMDAVADWHGADRGEPAAAAAAERARARLGAGGDGRLHRSAVAVAGGPLPRRWPTWPPRPAGLCGLPDREIVTLRRAALVHDIGMHGVPASILDKPGAADRRRIRADAPARATGPSGSWPAPPPWPASARSPRLPTSASTGPATTAACPGRRSPPPAGSSPPPTPAMP